MSYRRLLTTTIIVLGVSFGFFGMGSNPAKQFNQDMSAQQNGALIAGRNVNMVSGITLPGGDPWLQRQNEPSIAVSTRNPLHLLAGANDYRTVDMAASEGELPGIAGAAGGDAWLGIFKSFDGGESWKTTLLPGFPLDKTASPIKGYTTAADPIVRAGTNGLFYYSGIAFNRGVKEIGAFFVARFIDNNNSEGGDAIKYLDTKIISQGTSGQFIDMPRIAVDIPRLGAKTVTVDGQTIQAGNVYAAYTVFLGNLANKVHSKIEVTRSTDCGITWSSPIKISESSSQPIQGSAIAIDPSNGNVYIVFRLFKSKKETDAIFICKSTDGGQTFTIPTLIANINPFDQPSTDNLGDGVSDPIGTSFRTNSYPAITVDNQSNVYVAWADRRASIYARIVVATSFKGAGWNAPIPIDDPGPIGGHQVMPFLIFASGKVMAVWYDQRNTGATIDNWISDSSSIRQTVDIRAAQAAPGLFPQFQSIQVSRYLWVYDELTKKLYQGQWNPPNYPLFKGGTVPFHGDYVELTSAPTFIRDANGSWRYNTDAPNPVFHAVWTDNRDVRPPFNNNWTTYNPPNLNGSGQCITPANTGMRNQNIYSSRLTNELVVDIPGNAKPLTGLGYYLGTSEQIPRAFVVYVKNTTKVIRVLRFHILAAPASGTASFMEFNAVSQIDTVIAPYSTVARTLFVKSSNLNESATIEYYELDYNGNTLPGGLSGTVVLNADPSYPGLPQGSDLSSTEIHNPNIVNPNIVNWTIVNPNIVNPNIVNPNIVNPNIVNPNIVNPNIVNPNIVNPNIVNPNIVNPNIVNPNIVNPNIVNSSVKDMSESGSVNDVKCTVINKGNTISAYTLKTFSKEAFPEGIYLQLLVYKTNLTPATNGTNCDLKQEQHQELLLNVTNPNIVNPNIVNPNIVNPNIVNAAIENASFSLGPGEKAEVCLRVINPTPNGVMTLRTGQIFNMTSFLDSVGFATTAHAVNSEDARTVTKEKLAPKAAASKLVIGTSSLPDGKVGIGNSYSGLLSAYGGTTPYFWSLTSGELPSGLGLNSSTGEISGTPTAVGTSYFIVRVDDSGGDFDTQRYSLYVYQTTPAALAITTTSLPNGVKGYYYGATLEATGGVWPRTWSLASGSLPPGLSLDSGGVISGTPTSTGTFYFKPRVTAANGATAQTQQDLSIIISLSTGQNFTISGTVYDGQGTKLSGAVMRGLPNTPVTNDNGYYQDTVPEHWTGTVIPFFASVTFSPASRTYTDISQSRLTENYNAPVIQITGYAESCAAIGGNVTINGMNFGATSTGKGVALGGAGIHVDLTVNSWSDTQIIAKIPNDPSITPGYSYYIGIEKSDHSMWLSNINQMISICNSPGVPYKLAFDHQPVNTYVNSVISPPVTVKILDANNDLVTNATNQVTLTISKGQRHGTKSKAAVGGIATFDDLSIETPDSGYTLGASSAFPLLTPATSNSFNIITPPEFYPDQVNDGETGTTSTIANDSTGSIFQTFKPGANPLLAIKLRFRAGGGMPGGGGGMPETNSTINVRSGTFSGAIQATATTYVSPKGNGDTFTVTYYFPTPISAVPGATYVIEWLATDGRIMSWYIVETDSYSRGDALNSNGVPFDPPWDFVFTTYSTVQAHIVSTPSTPAGSSSGTTGVLYTYTTGGSTCSVPLHSVVEYRFDWDDDNVSAWTTLPTATHAWASAAVFKVKAQARCATENAILSSWSGLWPVTITAAPTYTIMASAGANGGISPSGSVVVNSGGNQTFTITPESCYKVSDVVVDGVSQGAITSYTFNNVTSNHTIAVTFGSRVIITTPSTLPDGEVGKSYAKQLEATCYGTNIIDIREWNLAPGSSLPAGLNLSIGGLISGTPSTPGSFTFSVLFEWVRYLFNPGGGPAIRTVVASDTKEFSLTINPSTVTISGTVATLGTVVPGVPISGVTITFSGGAGTATTGSDGTYTHTVSFGWSGTATPFKAGYSFSPASRSYSSVSSNLSNQDYTGTFLGGGVYFIVQPSNTSAGLAISPAVQVKVMDDYGAPLPGVTVTMTIQNNPGGGTLSGGTPVFTTESGIAIFPTLRISNPGNGYTLKATASLTGYGFSNFGISNPFNIL